MALTLRAVLDELDRLQAPTSERTIDEIGREEIVHSVARAALLGARGNSGVILSQLIRGAAEELVSRPGQLIDATLIGAALANAADRAYSSVREPAEGTILTVAREMAHQIVTDVAHSEDNPRLGPANGAPRAGPRDRGCARARRGSGPGLGQARARAARRAARGGRRRRRRLRADDHLRGRRGGAARRRPAAARPPRAGPHHAPRAQLGHVPLLHELRRHRAAVCAGALHRAARGARRLGARGRRRDDAEGAPAHRRARARHGACSTAPARSRASTSRDMRAAGRRARRAPRAQARRERAASADAAARGCRHRRRGACRRSRALRRGRGRQRRGAAARCSTSSACTRSTAGRR